MLADIPERAKLREVQRSLEQHRDTIAELDLEIETLRDRLAGFEDHYHARLAAEHDTLNRIANLARHMERWADLLRRRPEKTLGNEARRIDTRRRREIKRRVVNTSGGNGTRQSRDAALAPEPMKEEAPQQEEASRTDRLKEAYRALARRFHPDLARTEDERLKNSSMMAKINTLYRQGNLDRLRTMQEQAKGGEIDDADLDTDEQLEVLAERLQWFEAVVENLREERRELETSSTCEMLRNVERAQAAGKDLIGEIRSELQRGVRQAYNDVREAVMLVEAEVADYNRRGASEALAPKSQTGLERVFDPFADKRMVRLGLEQVVLGSLSVKTRNLADWVEQTAKERPHLIRLLMLTYVSDLSPFPLKGLESFDDLQLRFDYMRDDDDDTPSLEQSLVDADDLVEFGVKRATENVVHMGLRFRGDDIRQALQVSLQRLPVRRALKEVLGVLSEVAECEQCDDNVFPVPLYRLRGIDNMRAFVCPHCGDTLSSYWMPKGEDVQTVLNTAFVDFEIVSEWSFRLARATIGVQLVPAQVATMTVADLKRRIVDDVFGRQEVEITRGEVQLQQNGQRVAEKTRLIDLESQQFTIRFANNAKITEADALEIVRHRIRNRFRNG